ncbi:MAG: restriction endonuclease subunit S [Thermodesulfobacteriota bacterium]|nr:restriction endonuclease subunit S [Thermodesulfobacteriota bacterium]
MRWAEYPLSRLAERFISGGTPTTKIEEYWQGDIPWITGADFLNGEVTIGRRYINKAAVNNSATNIVPRGSILMVTRTGVGKIAIAPADIAISQDITGIVPKSGLSAKYILSAIRNKMAIILAAQRGATIKGVTRKDIEILPIPLAPPSEQRRIVEILDQADALRKKRAEADAKASRILPALFYKMFGDPATNPKGWPTDKLGNLFDVVGGGTPSKSIPEYWDGDIPWVSPKDMKFDVIRHTEDHITPEAIRNSATRLINQGAILVVYRSGILTHSFPVAIAGRDVTINQDLKALTSKSEVRNEFLFGLLSALPSIGLSCVKKGATVHNIDGSRFLGLEIPKPSKTIQDAFAVHLEILLTHKRKRQAVGAQIEKLFSVLLYRAFTGDLTVKWREARMKELLQEMEEQAKALETTNHTKHMKGIPK